MNIKTNVCTKTLVTLIYFFVTIITYGQKSYDLKIMFSGVDFDRRNLNIQFYQGYQLQSIPLPPSGNISANYNSSLNYPVVEIAYFSPKHSPAFTRFFLTRQISSLEIYYDSLTYQISVRKKAGLMNFEDAGQNKFEIFAGKELLIIKEFSKKYNYDFTNLEPGVLRQFETYSESLDKKRFEFVKNNPSSLYSLWLFMNEILGDPKYSMKDLKVIYDRYLKSNYSNTFEEKYILNKLDEKRLDVNTKAPLQDLPFSDQTGKTHTIKSFKGKPLIIVVWATWCVPCVAEIPFITDLVKKYGESLDLISFSTDYDKQKLTAFLTEKSLNWKVVYNRPDFCHMYGSDNGIPQVYLLDNNGVIIYSRSKSEDYGLQLLQKVVEKTVTGQGKGD